MGSITFTASAATPTNVRFRFEANPYPNTEPSYNTENVLVDSAEAKEYTIEIPSQGDQTFNSFLMYVVERDQPVMVTNVVVNAGPAEEPVDEDLVNLLTYHVYGDTVLVRMQLHLRATQSRCSTVRWQHCLLTVMATCSLTMHELLRPTS